MSADSWPVSRYYFAVGVAAALLAAAHLRFALVGAGPLTDEAWMTLVTRRMLEGDSLYRDTFAGVTPFAFYVQAALGRVFGAELGLLRILLHLLFVATLVLTAAIGEELRIPRPLSVIALAGVAIWTRPTPSSSYSAWALLFLLATMWCAARLLSTKRPLLLGVMAGAVAGLTFASKQNVGLLAIVALLVSIVATKREGRYRLAAAASGAFATMAFLWLIPIALSGAWPWFIAQGFTGKTVYLDEARMSYASYLRFTVPGVVYLLPLSLPFVAVIWRRSGAQMKDRAAIVLVFALAGLGAAYPRPDFLHIMLAAPGLALASVFAFGALPWPRRPTHAIAGVAVLVCGIHYAHLAYRALHAGPTVILEQPGMRGISALEVNGEALQNDSRFLTQSTPSGVVLILHPDAPPYYLATGLHNPTRYDYPMSSTFGASGQLEVIDAIREGRVPSLCLKIGPWPEMPPRELIAFVGEEMYAGPAREICQVFTPPPASAELAAK